MVAVVGVGMLVAVKVPLALPANTLRVVPPLLETTRSVSPSPLTSPATMPQGLVPTATLVAAEKLPAPLFSIILTLLLVLLAVAISVKLSLLKSPATRLSGAVPVEVWAEVANDADDIV